MLGCLSGCISSLWTGANMVYDRHNIYKKIDDYGLFLKVNNAIMVDKAFKNNQCALDIAIFQGDVLLTGHVATAARKQELLKRVIKVKGLKHLYYKVGIKKERFSTAEDSWITTKIRSQIFADSSIDPTPFKVVTSDGIVYLMGKISRDQAVKVIKIARQTEGVVRVVKLFKYIAYQ